MGQLRIILRGPYKNCGPWWTLVQKPLIIWSYKIIKPSFCIYTIIWLIVIPDEHILVQKLFDRNILGQNSALITSGFTAFIREKYIHLWDIICSDKCVGIGVNKGLFAIATPLQASSLVEWGISDKRNAYRNSLDIIYWNSNIIDCTGVAWSTEWVNKKNNIFQVAECTAQCTSWRWVCEESCQEDLIMRKKYKITLPNPCIDIFWIDIIADEHLLQEQWYLLQKDWDKCLVPNQPLKVSVLKLLFIRWL